MDLAFSCNHNISIYIYIDDKIMKIMKLMNEEFQQPVLRCPLLAVSVKERPITVKYILEEFFFFGCLRNNQ